MDPSTHRANNFDFLRQFAAFLVICGHSQALLGMPYQLLWGAPISAAGLFIFFSLSGYLVMESWLRDPRPVVFFAKRALRILPALFCCVVFCAIILGPAITRLTLSEYFHNLHVRYFFLNTVLYTWYFLPGVFETNPIPSAVNGSLWSLPVEFFCYISVCLLCLGGTRWRLARIGAAGLVAATTAFCLGVWYRGPQIVVYATDLRQAASVMPFFFVGAALRLLRDRLPLRLDLSLVAIFSLFAADAAGLSKLLQIAAWVVVPYMVLSFGVQATPILRSWGRFGDFSYGMYLYAFPIQQTLVQFYRTSLSVSGLVILTTLIVVGLAALSWHFVEKPALSAKPGRRRSSERCAGRDAILSPAAGEVA